MSLASHPVLRQLLALWLCLSGLLLSPGLPEAAHGLAHTFATSDCAEALETQHHAMEGTLPGLHQTSECRLDSFLRATLNPNTLISCVPSCPTGSTDALILAAIPATRHSIVVIDDWRTARGPPSSPAA